jgi:hypothetical protein
MRSRHPSLPEYIPSIRLLLNVSTGPPPSSFASDATSRPSTFTTGQFASGSQVSSALAQSLEACQADAYILVQQPNVSGQDFSTENSAPHLRRRMTSSNDSTSSHATVPEVFGQIDVEALRMLLQQKCGASIVNVDASRMCKIGGRKQIVCADIIHRRHNLFQRVLSANN